MANAVAEGAKGAGAEAALFTSAEFNASMVGDYDAIGFGCPSMGSESLEESEFEPMFSACEEHLKGKKIALFGSYGWGDGEWMQNWHATCEADGAVFAADDVICNSAPDDEALDQCKTLGAALAG